MQTRPHGVSHFVDRRFSPASTGAWSAFFSFSALAAGETAARPMREKRSTPAICLHASTSSCTKCRRCRRSVRRDADAGCRTTSGNVPAKAGEPHASRRCTEIPWGCSEGSGCACACGLGATEIEVFVVAFNPINGAGGCGIRRLTRQITGKNQKETSGCPCR